MVVPIAAAVGFAVGSGSQTPLFSIFGSVALLILVDFPGNRPARALAYCGLGVNGAVLITLGTLVADHPLVSVAVMFVLGVVVTFSGVLSEIVAAGQRATLLTFVLPACTPVGPISDRLLGWLIALAVCVPAALFMFPPRHHDELRRHAAQVCTALADCAGGHRDGQGRDPRDERTVGKLPGRRLPAGRADRGQSGTGAGRGRPRIPVGPHHR